MHEFAEAGAADGSALQALASRLRAIRDQDARPDPVAIENVVDVVLTTMGARLTNSETGLLKVVGELGRIIAETKAEIAEITVEAITAGHIPIATDELDAIVAHTAQATDRILESCETLDRMADVLDGAHAETLRHATTEIYEACCFQDITGQRITKIVKALKMIESKVLEISGSVDLFAAQSRPARGGETQVLGQDADLLHGPGLPSVAADQADIDKLLADFD